MPYILGATGTSGTFGTQYTLTDTLPTFYLVKDLSTAVYTYNGCVVSKATFRGRKGEHVEAEIEIAGVDESQGAAGSFPSLSLSTEQPWQFFASAAGITLNGTGNILADEWELVIDNMVDKERFFNSQVRTAIPALDRDVTFKAMLPFTSTELALYNAMNPPGVAASVVFTNGSNTLAFNMASLIIPAKTPVIQGKKKEILLPLEGVVRKLGSTLELVVESTS